MLPALIFAATFFAAPERPAIKFEEQTAQALFGTAFERAEENLLDINTVPFDAKEYNQAGLMRGTRFVRAGGGYGQPWTRDAAINSWNAASLLEPEVARDTLWSVTRPDDKGQPIVQRDNQWWDKVIWVVGAWNHARVTGDREFLKTAYGVSERLLREMRATRFDARYGLFQGPSFFNDGIAGYPAPPAEPNDGGSSFVLDHKGTDRIMPLSTNCLYVGAYRAAAEMAKSLGKPSGEWSRNADALKKAINAHLWSAGRRTYGYFLSPEGALDPSQEGCGLAFAVLFDVADAKRGRAVLKAAHEEPFGVTDVWPHFPRFSDERPGRHNAIVWPMVQGMWARARAKVGDVEGFQKEAGLLASLAQKSNGRFFEIYNARTGAVDGGWQNGHQWGSEPDQTWSATAYLSMVLEGLLGMRFDMDGLRFQPTVPASWGGVTVSGLKYRRATLDVHIVGSGTQVGSLRLDGKPVKRVAGDLVGAHRVEITLR